AVEAMNVGCIDFFTRDTGLDELALRVRAALKLASLRAARRDKSRDRDAIFGESALARATSEQVRVAAAGRAGVLVRGEVGSGKMVVARAVHGLSSRRDGALVEVDCAALTPGHATRDLFGHAADGASPSRGGLVESANGGTLVLDGVSTL